MNTIAYTSIYQLMYLFIETMRGNMSNQKVIDSLQHFLYELEAAIGHTDNTELDPIKDCTHYYYDIYIHTQDDVDKELILFDSLAQRLGVKALHCRNFFQQELEKILKDNNE